MTEEKELKPNCPFCDYPPSERPSCTCHTTCSNPKCSLYRISVRNDLWNSRPAEERLTKENEEIKRLARGEMTQEEVETWFLVDGLRNNDYFTGWENRVKAVLAYMKKIKADNDELRAALSSTEGDGK